MFGTWADLHKMSYHLQEANGQVTCKFDVKSVESPLSLAALLSRLSGNGAQSTDPRDMVFALLGLANDVKELGIVLDYSRDCRTIYTNVAAALFTKQKLIRLLHLCQFPKRLHGLPN